MIQFSQSSATKLKVIPEVASTSELMNSQYASKIENPTAMKQKKVNMIIYFIFTVYFLFKFNKIFVIKLIKDYEIIKT